MLPTPRAARTACCPHRVLPAPQTQGDAQGNDVGSQYRSGIYTADDEQATVARACLTAYDGVLRRQGYGPITSEVKVRSEFW